MMHWLNMDSLYQPIKKKKWNFTPKSQKVISKEMNKLINIDFTKEVTYLDWLANVVLIEKKNKKWWSYVDFIDLNKACLRDCYPLSHID